MIRLELVEGTAKKFWEIDLATRTFTTRWGRIGTKGQEKKQSFSSRALANHTHDSLVAAKRKKGYRDAGAKPIPKAGPRNAELEAAIRAEPDDPGVRSVYADWLQGQGNPLGELIALQLAIEGKKVGPAKRTRADKIIAELGLPEPRLATFGWHWGMWQWIRIENTVDWMDSHFDAVGLARPLFEGAPCAALRELRIGVLRWDFNHEDVPAVLAVAAKQPWAAALCDLTLGDVSSRVDMAHHSIGAVGAVISKAFPGLRTLKLHSSEQDYHGTRTFEVAKLDLPALESLVIETCSMSKRRLKDVLAAKLPRLTKLELWFGSSDQGADATLANLRDLLAGKTFPNVTHLGLRNAEFEDELARTIHTSALAPRLAVLDLSMGTMDDAAASELASHARSFRKLQELWVFDNFLTPAGVAALKQAFPRVKLRAEDQREPFDDGERYVSVRE